MRKITLFCISVLLIAPIADIAGAQTNATHIRSVDIAQQKGGVFITIYADGAVNDYEEFAEWMGWGGVC